MALVYASAKGEIGKVTILLAMGARVDVREQGFTPLLAAAQFGHTEVCQLLLANGSDLEERQTGTLDSWTLHCIRQQSVVTKASLSCCSPTRQMSTQGPE